MIVIEKVEKGGAKRQVEPNFAMQGSSHTEFFYIKILSNFIISVGSQTS